MDLSARQACGLWSELEQAYFQQNLYGGDTAELYAYRFSVGELGGACERPGAAEDALLAARRLYGLLQLFQEVRRCRLWVSEKAFGSWVIKYPFIHRVHVKVVPKGQR
jgi:hypothetical protein